MTAADVASGFSISGLLDAGSRTAGRFPVKEIPLEDITEHPGNVAYSMDDEGIARLAESIKRDGLTDLPLVRRMQGGGFQMISGHRRMAAYRLLAQEGPSYSRIPCRIAADVSDEQALVLLHTANFFTRSLTITERAAATKALGLQVEQMRVDDPSLAGVRTEDVKARIVEEMTGRKVSGKTIKREEALAQKLEELTPEWRAEADAGHVSASSVAKLAGLTQESQHELYQTWADKPRGKQGTTRFIEKACSKSQPTESKASSNTAANKRLLVAEEALSHFVESLPRNLSAADTEAISRIAELARQAADAVSGLPKPSRALGNPSDSNRSE